MKITECGPNSGGKHCGDGLCCNKDGKCVDAKVTTDNEFCTFERSK